MTDTANPYVAHLLRVAQQTPSDDDYIGEGGLIYCGRCRTPRQYVMQKDNLLHGLTLPISCQCREAARAARDREQFDRRVDELRRRCFPSPAMTEWTFSRDNGRCGQMQIAQRYVAKWPEITAKNYGLFLWGDVGTGKSYLAGCIANAILARGIAVKMTSFPDLLAELSADLDGRASRIRELAEYPLLILDDFGVERSTDFAQELIFAVVDARSRARKPLIVTSNLTPEQLKQPTGTMQARIFDRIRAMCLPLHIRGENQRERERDEKYAAFAGDVMG
ncbi:MAG: ATP-binding protein [Clostridia bacterium]|nr:ATP-binding protein [Clostridia bacterium]